MTYRSNRITELFGIQYPIVQGGMVWCSGWQLASAVSNAGGLGLIGSGSMTPDILREHIKKCKKATKLPFGVNIPLLYPKINETIDAIIEEGVKMVFTSAGNPMLWTKTLKEKGIIVVHVISNTKFALKAVEAGVDAIVAEGFEAGGHNGREETTTFCLIPQIANAVDIPIMAAGGINSGKTMLAAMILGAEGVQIGTRFAVAEESSAHENFKNRIIAAKEGDTKLMLKKLAPVRLLNNTFSQEVNMLEQQGADEETLKSYLSKGRAKKGMFEGDMEEGELEIGQCAALINKKQSVEEIIKKILVDFDKHKLKTHKL